MFQQTRCTDLKNDFFSRKKKNEISSNHKYFRKGIDENMSIDNTLHSLFGYQSCPVIYCPNMENILI